MHNSAPSKKSRLALRDNSDTTADQESQIILHTETTLDTYVQAVDLEKEALDELDIAKNALITLKASHAKERADLTARHTSEWLQAESTLLRLRQRFLETQKNRGLIRRQLDKNEKILRAQAKKERENQINSESDRKYDRQERLDKIKVKISDLEKSYQVIDGLSRRTLTLSLDDPDLRRLLRFQQPGEKIHELLHRLARGVKREIIEAKNELVSAKAGPHISNDPHLLEKIFTPRLFDLDANDEDDEQPMKRLMPPPKSAMDLLAEQLSARKPAAIIGTSGTRVDDNVPTLSTPKKKLSIPKRNSK